MNSWDRRDAWDRPAWNGMGGLGGPGAPGIPPRKSVVTIVVAVNVAVFLIQMIIGDLNNGGLGWFSAVFGLSRAGLAEGFLWQPLTYMFLHGGVFHILANMLVIYFAGRQVEQLLGPAKFLTVYFLAGILGGLAQIAFSPGLVVGASAAGFAVLLVFTTLMPEMRLTLLLFFIIPLQLKAKHLALGAFAVSLLFTLFPPGDNVGHLAHLVGCITGWAYVRLLVRSHSLPGVPSPFGRSQSRRRADQRPPVRTDDRFVSEDIDAILDKISRHGMHSLTPAERRALEEGRERIARRSSIR